MLSGGRFFYKQLDSFPKLTSSAHVRNNTVAAKHKKSVEVSQNDVVIPKRIERGPTDILQALSVTVGYDPTGFHYKYPDDPFFKCYSRFQKKILAFSLESGRESAMWIIKKYPAIFQRNVSEPHIKAFCPKLPRKKKGELAEEDLIDAIEERNVPKSIRIYKNLKKKNCDVSQWAKQCLLELVCFYNCSPVKEMTVERTWFKLKNEPEERRKSGWKKSGFAEELFSEMDPKCPLANSALIQGMFKHHDSVSAMEQYEKAREANVKLSVEVYNSVLQEGFLEMKKEPFYFQVLLKEMADNQIAPNDGTLSSLFIALLKPKFFLQRKLWADDLFAEFVKLGIKPSLTTYNLLFEIYVRVLINGEMDALLVNEDFKALIARIESERHEIQREDDLSFFANVSSLIRVQFQDPDLLLRLVEMYFKNGNSKFVVTYADVNELFSNLCELFFRTKPFETAIELFELYAFKKFSPDQKMLRAVVEAIGENLASEYIPKLWKWLKDGSFAQSRPVLVELLKLVQFFSDEQSKEVFYEVAKSFMERTEKFAVAFEEEGAFSNIVVVFMKADDEEGIMSVLQIAENAGLDILSQDSLKTVHEYALSKNSASLILKLLSVARETNEELASELAKNSLSVLSEDDKIVAETFIQPEGLTKRQRRGYVTGSRGFGAEEFGNEEFGGIRGGGGRGFDTRRPRNEEFGNEEFGGIRGGRGRGFETRRPRNGEFGNEEFGGIRGREGRGFEIRGSRGGEIGNAYEESGNRGRGSRGLEARRARDEEIGNADEESGKRESGSRGRGSKGSESEGKEE